MKNRKRLGWRGLLVVVGMLDGMGGMGGMEGAIANSSVGVISRTVTVLDLDQNEDKPKCDEQSVILLANTVNSSIVQLKLKDYTLNLEFVLSPHTIQNSDKRSSIFVPEKLRHLGLYSYDEYPRAKERKLLFNSDEICGFLSQEYTKLSPEIDLNQKIRNIAVILQSNYLYRGYINSVVQEPQKEDVETVSQQKGGLLKFEVAEGQIGEVNISELQRLKKAYIRNRLQQGVGVPLNINDIEEQLRLLREDPVIERIEATLKAPQNNSETAYKSDLDVIVVEAKPFTASLSIDNFSPPSVGSIRFGGEMQYRNLAFSGDSIRLFGYTSETSGNRGLDLSYQAPLNPMNGVLQFRWAPNWNKITEGRGVFSTLGIRGKSNVYQVNYRQPLFIQTIRDEFAVSLGLTVQDGKIIFLEETPFQFNINNRTAVIRFGQEYLHRTFKSAFLARSQFSLGTDAFGLFNPTRRSGKEPDGYFFSWLGQVQWVRRWKRLHQSVVQAELQLASDSLLPSQQFVVGGGQSLRGYRQNALARDNGFRGTAEWRITLWDLERGKLKRESFTDEKAYIDLLADNSFVRKLLALPELDRQFCKSPNAELILNLSYTKDRCEFMLKKCYTILHQKCEGEQDCDVALSELYKREWLPTETEGGVVVTLNPFMDGAFLWNQRNNPTPVPRQQSLLGIGIGLGIETRKSPDARQPSFSGRVDLGIPLISAERRIQDLQDIGLYFSIRYQF